MFTWISDRLRWLVLLAVMGCETATLSGPVAREVSVGDARITLTGPPGYCIDSRGSRSTGAETVLLMAPCRSDSGVEPALLSAAVTATDPALTVAGASASLEAFLKSPPGRAALSRTGNPETVTVIGTARRDDAVIVLLRDTSPPVVRGLSPTYRRAFFDQAGALVAVSVLGFAADPLTNDESRTILADFIAAIRAANAQAEPES